MADADLLALGAWARPRDRRDLPAWAELTRQLLAESPLRDLASAAIEARDVVMGRQRRHGGVNA